MMKRITLLSLILFLASLMAAQSTDELQKMRILRKILYPMDELAAIEFMIDRLKNTKTNEEFFEAMKRS